MKNNIEAVRNLMIEGMERLLNPEEGDTFDVEKAKALAGLGKVVIESAKVEVAALQVAEKFGSKIQGTGFINIDAKPKQITSKTH
jgi:hypothetical protein